MAEKTILFISRADQVTPLFAQFKEHGLGVIMSDSLSSALKVIEQKKPVLIFSQVRLPGYRIEDLLHKISGLNYKVDVVAFTEQGSASEAKRILELGAKDYWLTPLIWDKIKAILPQKKSRATKDIRPKSTAKFEIIGEHPSIKNVLALARRVANSKATVLISGESGTGKELFARYLHYQSSRAEMPFVAINCAALPEHLLESELFGHEKGAFTGAISRKLGKFELASGGTILLDEITEMDMSLQAKLLRVLQENEIDRVGGTETIKVDVRVLATTNRDVEECVQKKEFRQDLFYRLNVIPLKLPPLRERGSDVLLLAEYFVRKFCREYGVSPLEFSEQAKKWLMDYDWPGNVRELQNLMERAVLLAGKGKIEVKHFLLEGEEWPDEICLEEKKPPIEKQDFSEKNDEVLPLHEMEKRMILKSLQKTGGNRTQASELLGISVRTLRNKLNEYRKQGLVIP
ncbi:sigma-54-dependent Fis family transcriptional regulator [Desulfohalobiaceae bacterium Ax17]|uniref:sigma-54-dependent transcriptional regulator n=1 Tax=Desulfovulcanus ferrireducens TaxID=2831190 RepID=UPI00207BC460|nr:sigma-54 dependent transcriptional regulator [Desulfovulcanus ferrireducens]MBT8763337.1 sigma-54-dependent Fis family transcriptional regulator [Desulfovulcanus ferrireducens]